VGDKSTVEQRLAALETANATLEAKNRELAAEITRLRPPSTAMEEVRYRALAGQAGLFDKMGNRVYLPDQEPAPASNTVGGNSGLNPWVTRDDGTKVYAPDGVERRRDTGEVVIHGAPDPAGAMTGPVRTYAHQRHVEMIDRLFPVIPAPMPDPDDANDD